MQRDFDERVTTTLGDWKLLGKVSDALRPLARPLKTTRLRALKNFLNGTWLGHPLHPLLSDLPIGAWTTAMALDAATLFLGERGLGKASAYAIGFGVLTASGTTVTGLMDYVDTHKPEDRVALAHGVVNTAATLLFTASFLMRKRARWRAEPSHIVVAGWGTPS